LGLSKACGQSRWPKCKPLDASRVRAAITHRADSDPNARRGRSREADKRPTPCSSSHTAPLPTFLSPRELAELLSVSKDKVLGWIHAGELQAIDVRSPQSSRPQYRIPGDAVQAFSNARSTSPLPNGFKTKSKRDNPSRPPPKVEFF